MRSRIRSRRPIKAPTGAFPPNKSAGLSAVAASKTEVMYFPPSRLAYEAADTSRFYINGTGFIDFCEKFKYLGSMLHDSLTSDADVDKRITSATAGHTNSAKHSGLRELHDAKSVCGFTAQTL